MNSDDRTIEQRLDRLERLEGETQERLNNIERLLRIVERNSVLGQHKLPTPIPPDNEHRGLRKVPENTEPISVSRPAWIGLFP